MSRFLKALLAFYVYGNFHISLGAVALSEITGIFLQGGLPHWLAAFTFCATFCLYNVQRVYASWKLGSVERHTTERHGWVDRNRLYMSLLLIIAFLFAAIIFVQRAFITGIDNDGIPHTIFWISPGIQKFYIVCIVSTILSVGYALPVIPAKTRWKRLRDLPGLKIFLIAIVWGIVTVIWPYVVTVGDCSGNCEKYIWKEPYSSFIEHWFVIVTAYIFAITIPFDIRDYLIDGASVKSLPAILGIRRARILGMLLLIPVLMLCAYGVVQQHDYRLEMFTVAAFCIPTALVIGYATPNRHEYYFSLLTDGLLILLFLLVLIAAVIRS
jgi:hypothetical protein